MKMETEDAFILHIFTSSVDDLEINILRHKTVQINMTFKLLCSLMACSLMWEFRDPRQSRFTKF